MANRVMCWNKNIILLLLIKWRYNFFSFHTSLEMILLLKFPIVLLFRVACGRMNNLNKKRRKMIVGAIDTLKYKWKNASMHYNNSVQSDFFNWLHPSLDLSVYLLCLLVSYHLPSCHSKPVRLFIFLETQKEKVCRMFTLLFPYNEVMTTL